MDEYFDQFKNYYFSSLEIINVLKSDNKEYYNNDWSDEIFFSIPSDFIINWKSLINFKKICETMELNKNNKNIDKQKNKIIELMRNNKVTKKQINNLDVNYLHNSLSLVKSVGINDVSPYSDFLLISKNAWYSFDRNKDLSKNAKKKNKKAERNTFNKIED